VNERLRQFEKESKLEIFGLGARRDIWEKALEKYAELIVRECIQVCEPILDEPYEDMTEFGKGLVEGQDVAIERIKEHFGVEE
jgi:hypothetical protein